MQNRNQPRRSSPLGFRRPSLIDQLEARTLLSASDPDPTFSGDGYTDAPTGVDVIATVVQPDGKAIAVGNVVFGADRDMVVVRYNVNGTLDTSFSGDGIAYIDLRDADYATAVALTPQGKIVVGGYTTSTFDVGTDFAVARLNANGTPDTSFSGDGKLTWHVGTTDDRLADLVLQADGKALLVGTADPSATAIHDAQIIVGRITVGGTVDTAFGGLGTAYHRATANSYDLRGSSIGILPTGKIVVGGTAIKQIPRVNYASQNSPFYVFALNANGTRATDVFTRNFYDWDQIVDADPAIAPDYVEALDARLNDLQVLPDGRVAVVGRLTYVNSSLDNVSNIAALLLSPSGGIVAERLAEPKYNNRSDTHSVTYSDGKLIVSGWGETVGPFVAQFNATDLSTDQAFAGRFNTVRYVPYPNRDPSTPIEATDVAVAPNGRIVVVATLEGYEQNGSEMNGGAYVLRLLGDRVPNDTAPVTLQAESAALSGGTVAAGNNGGFTGSGYADFGGAGSAVTFTVERITAGGAALQFRYANGGGTARPLSIRVNGVTVGTLNCPPTGTWSTWGTAAVNVMLPAGTNTIQAVASTSAGGGNVDALTITRTSTAPAPVTLQAESATLVGTTRQTANGGFNGTGYADFGGAGSYVQLSVNWSAAGPTNVQLRYANGGATNRPISVSVNGVVRNASVTMNGTGGWSSWQELTLVLDLAAGNNTIRFTSTTANGINLDQVVVG